MAESRARARLYTRAADALSASEAENERLKGEWFRDGYEDGIREASVDLLAERDALRTKVARLEKTLKRAVQFEQDFCDGKERKHPWLSSARAALTEPSNA